MRAVRDEQKAHTLDEIILVVVTVVRRGFQSVVVGREQCDLQILVVKVFDWRLDKLTISANALTCVISS